MSDEHYIFRSPPDDLGNVFEIESPQPIGHRIVRECVAWYWTQPHHRGNIEPEHDRFIWISTLEVGSDSVRSWRYLPAKKLG